MEQFSPQKQAAVILFVSKTRGRLVFNKLNTWVVETLGAHNSHLLGDANGPSRG